MSLPAAPRPDAAAEPGEPGYRIGTLVYTRRALATVMFWMLWADLCIQIMEQLPSVIPLQLRALGASATVVGFIKDSLTAILAVFLLPFIGLQSDRHRGPLGRRRPFLFWCTFPVCGFLIALGFAAPIARAVYGLLHPLSDAISPAATGIAMIAIFAAGFFVFNSYVLQIFQYMVADVIPREALGRFFGLFRSIGALGGFVFNRWIFGQAENHVELVYTGSALLYGIAFLLLVWRVKEGSYPPPEPRAANPLAALLGYVRECYANPFYLKIFCMSALFWCAYVPFNTFVLFFALKGGQPDYAPTLGLDAQTFGEIRSLTFVPKVAVALLVGPLIDRLDTMRVLAGALAAMALVYAIGFFVTVSADRFMIWWIVDETVVIVFTVAYLSLFPKVFPQEKFGQYFGANQVFFSIALVIAPILCGALLQALRDYSYIFLWSATMSAFGAAMAFRVRRDWLAMARMPAEKT